MFTFKEILYMINSIKADIELLKKNSHVHNFVSCETCGCLLNKKDAIEGNPEIRTVQRIGIAPGKPHGLISISDLSIFVPYYCRSHAPQKKEGE